MMLIILILLLIYEIRENYRNYVTKCDSKKNLIAISKQYTRDDGKIDSHKPEKIFISKFNEEEQKSIYFRAYGKSLKEFNDSNELYRIDNIYEEFIYSKEKRKNAVFMSIYDYKNHKVYDILKRDLIIPGRKEHIQNIEFSYIELKYKCILKNNTK